MADLLVDEEIGQNLVMRLRAGGYRAFHTLEFLPKGSRDSLVFAEAQARQLTLFTYNRGDYLLLAAAWADWGHGDHFGIITRPLGRSQLPPDQTYRILETYCLDISTFLNRIEFF